MLFQTITTVGAGPRVWGFLIVCHQGFYLGLSARLQFYFSTKLVYIAKSQLSLPSAQQVTKQLLHLFND